MIEKCLIEHCAPTLASLKAANLFNACCEEGENIDLQISRWNQLMNPKGVKLLALRSRGNRSLVYVYREKQLAQNLNRPGVARFLKQSRITKNFIRKRWDTVFLWIILRLPI